MLSDPWAQQRDLARTTVVWSAASIAAGLALDRSGRSRPGGPGGGQRAWWRSFGRQHLGWGVVDLGIVAVTGVLQRRRRRATDDPWAPAVQDHERATLHRVLAVNTVLDLGYVAVGGLMARAANRKLAGAGVAIVIQGAFLAAHDGWHTHRSRATR